LKIVPVKALRKPRITPKKRVSKIPCNNCQFFNKNPYLKCAAQPNKVLKQEAFDCTDYQPIYLNQKG
jgi:hypothetical protein